MKFSTEVDRGSRTSLHKIWDDLDPDLESGSGSKNIGCDISFSLKPLNGSSSNFHQQWTMVAGLLY